MTQSWPAHEHAREFLWTFDRFCIIPNLQLTPDLGPGLEFRFVLDPTVPKGMLWTLWWNTSDDDPTQSPALTWPCTILVRWFRLMAAWSDGDLTWHPNCSPVHPSLFLIPTGSAHRSVHGLFGFTNRRSDWLMCVRLWRANPHCYVSK